MIFTEPSRAAGTILMVRPVDFGFNEETSADNPFQSRPIDAGPVRAAALREFDDSVRKLQDAGVEVLVLEKQDDACTPDAVFPNNWIATEGNGSVYLFPMLAPNRRMERTRYPQVAQLFSRAGLDVQRVHNIGAVNEDRGFLEGTGSMCLDHAHRIIYAALSRRTDAKLLERFQRLAGYEKVVAFHTCGSSGVEFYHTNVMMNLGERFVVVCAECIPDGGERKKVMDELQKYLQVIDISLEQTEKHFCGNVIQLQSRNGDGIIVMSRRALNGFRAEQKRLLERHGRLLALTVDHIEDVGGGSARCMIAEVFLPRR
jgi:hypothetical protein